ncbi:MAG: GNAT family N-acetyltransferase [Candidatus Daviesbacteria bacterium]|nr:GNAT family N-acetyltransferase [Candidatus Daviesbacteria bacterium]
MTELQPLEINSPNNEVILRQFAIADAEEIFKLIDRNREHLSQHGEDTAEKYPDLESVRESILQPADPKRLRFAIRDRQGIFLGGINLTPDKDNPQRGEVGYYLGSEATGKGYVTRAMELLSNYAFNTLQYLELYCLVAETNTPSIRVMQRAGFVKTGRQRDEKKNQEMIVFSKLKKLTL